MTAKRRSYNEFCGLALALDVVGERWTLLVVRNLVLGPQRYSELLRGLPGITTNLLATRLKELEANGLVEKVALSSGESSQAYRLTELGLLLEPAVHALGSFGWQWMQRAPRPDEHRSLEWLLVALRRRYRGGVSMRAELVADGTPYRMALEPGGVEIARGTDAGADLQLRGAAAAFVRLFVATPPDAACPAEITITRGAARFAEFSRAFGRGDRVLSPR